LIIMTSNLGTDLLADAKTPQERQEVIDKALRSFFRPEFLNRLDDIVVFHSLSEKEIVTIVDIQLLQLQSRLRDRRVEIRATEAAKRQLARVGFDAQFGARPLKRTIQRLVIDPLTVRLLSGDIRDGSLVEVGVKSGQIEITAKPPASPPAPAA
ncbi:MAG: AAA family ATPase, partial [Thermoplasmata archaeon]|nr:AAA family ATPase [Thermoplasmata archaeon]